MEGLLTPTVLISFLSTVTVIACSEPGHFHSPDAILNFVSGNKDIRGHLEFYNSYNSVIITGQIDGLSPGLHGFHVHEKGDLSNKCTSAGGHFNPFRKTHGGPRSFNRHVGDLGNIVTNEYGFTSIYIVDNQISLDPNSKSFIGGRAIVVHEGVDDLGQGGNEESLKTGNAGGRAGCGIIETRNPYQYTMPFGY